MSPPDERSGTLRLGSTYIEDSRELVDIVYSFSVKLVLELVGDLLLSVSPVCHDVFDCVRLGGCF